MENHQPLAYHDEDFLESTDARPLRILAEYLEPLRRFKQENIQDTVVFFGSARVHSREEAEHRLELFLNATERAQIPSFLAFANGLRNWQQELLAYFDQPTSDGYAEEVINKIKVIKRRAYGLPSFDSYRSRILVACG